MHSIWHHLKLVRKWQFIWKHWTNDYFVILYVVTALPPSDTTPISTSHWQATRGQSTASVVTAWFNSLKDEERRERGKETKWGAFLLAVFPCYSFEDDWATGLNPGPPAPLCGEVCRRKFLTAIASIQAKNERSGQVWNCQCFLPAHR